MDTQHSIAPSAAAANSQLGAHPIAIEKDVLRRRIYAPLSYASVRNVAVVPIVHSDCATLASWFPLVWRRRRDATEFVAIRALLDDQRAQLPAVRTLLPLILHAYPFVHHPDHAAGADSPKMLDDVFADAPTDVGASITTVHRRLSRATTSRLRILDRFSHELAPTAAVSERLAELDLFEPWPLKFDIEGHSVEIPDLMIIRRSEFNRDVFAQLLQRHGMPCAQILGFHRISLFRAGALLAMAKTFFKTNCNDRSPDADNALARGGSNVGAWAMPVSS